MKSLVGKDNIRLVGADKRRSTVRNQFCHITYQISPFTEVDKYKKAITDIVKKENIDAVFPALHDEVDIYKTFRYELTAKVALPISDIFNILGNKESICQYLTAIDLSDYIPKYIGFSESNEIRTIAEYCFPEEEQIVVKPVNSHGATGFTLLIDLPHFLKALQKGQRNIYNIADYHDVPCSERRLAMAYLEGTEYSVDVFLHEGSVITTVPRERKGVSNGLVLDGTVVYRKALIEAASLIATKLATSGFLNLQFMATEKGYKLTDVNPRFCGSQIMSLGANVNFPYLFLQYQLLGEQVSVQPIWNTRMLRYREQVFIHETS